MRGDKSDAWAGYPLYIVMQMRGSSLYIRMCCVHFLFFFHPIPIHCLKILSQRRGLGANFFFFFRGRYVEGIQLITPSIYIRFFYHSAIEHTYCSTGLAYHSK